MMISTVRSNVENATGFVRDWRRINVAITRAKWQPQCCWTNGNVLKHIETIGNFGQTPVEVCVEVCVDYYFEASPAAVRASRIRRQVRAAGCL